MNIVLYNIDEHPEFVDFVVDSLVEESAEVRQIGVDKNHVRKLFLTQAISCIVALENEQLVGTILAMVGTEWYNPQAKFVSDLLVWVRPDKRGGTVFIKMLRVLENWALTANIPKICLSQTTGIEVEKTAKLYERLGYDIVGFTSVKELTNV